MSSQINAKELIEKLTKEIGRLQKLCRDNGIDPTSPTGMIQSINVTAKVQVFKTKEESEAALADSQS
jgi:hypothetical protein